MALIAVTMERVNIRITPREASTHKVLAGEHFQQGDEIVAVA